MAQRYEETKVTELERQLTNLESNYTNTLNQIYKAVQANTLTLKIFNPITNELENKSAYDWAVYHFEQTNYENQLLKDTVSYETETNGIAEKLVDYKAIGLIKLVLYTEAAHGDEGMVLFRYRFSFIFITSL